MINNIFFDFDGVLAESVFAKTEAFRLMYIKYGNEIADKVVDFHINNGGVSRFEKFKIWEKELLGKDVSEQMINDLATQFSNLVMNNVINSNEVTGAHQFLLKYYKKLNFWIITGTPTNEIVEIAKKRGISSFFKGIHGSPNNKICWTEYLIEKFNLDRNKTIFLGDATTDFEAAQFSKLNFALKENEENKILFSNYKGIRFSNFTELEDKLIQLQLL